MPNSARAGESEWLQCKKGRALLSLAAPTRGAVRAGPLPAHLTLHPRSPLLDVWCQTPTRSGPWPCQPSLLGCLSSAGITGLFPRANTSALAVNGRLVREWHPFKSRRVGIDGWRERWRAMASRRAARRAEARPAAASDDDDDDAENGVTEMTESSPLKNPPVSSNEAQGGSARDRLAQARRRTSDPARDDGST